MSNYVTIETTCEVCLTLEEISKAVRMFPKKARRRFLLDEIWSYVNEYDDPIMDLVREVQK
jgi:hypothetical protein